MKIFFSLVFLFYNFAAQADEEVLRQLFAVASIDQKSNEELLERTKSATLKSDPLTYAYHAGALMAMANHVFWPGTKLSYFDQGKAKLEKAVNFALKNVEVRFIRYCIQKEVPAMLGYYGNVNADKQFILANINTTNWSSEYKQEVKDFLNN
jgi:hypothetical protein